METRITERDGSRFVECTAPITDVGDAIELVLACADGKSSCLLIDRGCLPSDFFDLSTRFAGEFIQKLQNYRIRVAAVIPPDDGRSDTFERFWTEARRGNPFRVFDERAEAEAWLLST